MDRGSSEEGVDDFLRPISRALTMSYPGSAILLFGVGTNFSFSRLDPFLSCAEWTFELLVIFLATNRRKDIV